MTDTHEGATPGEGPDDGVRDRLEPIELWYRDAGGDDRGERARRLQAARTRDQVEAIVGAFDRAKVPLGVHREPRLRGPYDGDAGPVDYFYQPERVLTRDVDAPRVYAVLGIDPPVEKGDRATPQQPGGLHVVLLPRGRDAVDAVAEVDDRLGVGVAVPDHLLHVTGLTWCNAIEPEPATDAKAAVDLPGDLGARSRVSVVDTGLLEDVVREHDDLLHGVEGDPEPPYVGHYSGHGTFIAGVVRTHAPAAQVRVESAMAVGGATFESDLFMQLTQALDWVPDVISYSGGTRTKDNLPPLSFQVFWETRLRHLKGTVLVAAAGNDGDRGPFWPAAFPWAVSVGALDEARTGRAGFSNLGGWVDVYAPGERIVGVYPKGTYTYQEAPRTGQTADFPDGLAAWSGTSFSAPMVAGLIAARMTWSGENARQAADALLERARSKAVAGVGAVLTDDADATAAP